MRAAPESTHDAENRGIASALVTLASTVSRALPWFLVLLALAFLAVLPPFAMLAAGGAAFYAHGKGLRGARNAAIVILVIATLFSILFLVFGVGGGTDGGLAG